MSPSVISIGVFFFSSFVFAICKDTFYGTDIHFVTVITVALLLFAVIAGEKVALITKRNTPSSLKKEKNNKVFFGIKGVWIFVLSVFTIAVSVWYFYDAYKFSLSLGNTPGNYMAVTQYIRHATNYGTGLITYSSGLLLGQAIILSRCIVYFSIFTFFNSWILFKKIRISNILPCFGYCLYIFICDSRGYLIMDALIILFIIYFLLIKKGLSNRRINKIIIYSILAVLCLFFVLFRILGYRTGTSYRFSFIENVADYVSSGILGLDIFLTNGAVPNSYFAENILRNIYIKMNDFGFSFALGPSNMEFFKFLKGESNIYSGLYPPLKDLGVFSFFFLFVWSFITQKIVVKTSNIFVKSFLVGLAFFPLVMISIGGEWANVIGMTSIYMIVYVCLIKFFLCKEKR